MKMVIYCIYFDIDGNFFLNLNEVNYNVFFFRYKNILCVSWRVFFKNLESKIEIVLFKRVIFLICIKDI